MPAYLPACSEGIRVTLLDSYYNGSADEESRQHYATVWIQRYQRFRASSVEMEDVTFAQLLKAFRHYGELYDQGYRVRDGEESAA